MFRVEFAVGGFLEDFDRVVVFAVLVVVFAGSRLVLLLSFRLMLRPGEKRPFFRTKKSMTNCFRIVDLPRFFLIK